MPWWDGRPYTVEEPGTVAVIGTRRTGATVGGGGRRCTGGTPVDPDVRGRGGGADFRRAPELLFIAQPAVGQQIAGLESLSGSGSSTATTVPPG
jgi:hypothetical protein